LLIIIIIIHAVTLSPPAPSPGQFCAAAKSAACPASASPPPTAMPKLRIVRVAEQAYLAPLDHGAGSYCRSLYAQALSFPPKLSSHSRDVFFISGGGSLTRPLRDARRFPSTIAPRTKGYAYYIGVWGLSLIHGPFSVAPCPNP
jgi:hypothetical protein